MDEECDYCGRSFDWFSVGCKNESQHKPADLANRIADAIEDDLRGRSGMDWGGIDNECQQEIRESWAAIIRERLK